MGKQERMDLYNDMRKGSQMIIEKMGNIARDTDKFSWSELMYMADILKDLSETEKNLAKACHYSKDIPEL